MSKVVTHQSPSGRLVADQSNTAADVVLLSELLETWLAGGVITPQQAERMAAGPRSVVVPRVPRKPAGPSLAVEALGYLGGVIMLVGAMSIVGLYWDDLNTAARLVLVGAVAALLFTAGLLVTPALGEAAGRLRAVTWAGTTVAVAGFLALLSADVLDWKPAAVRVTAAGGAAAVAAVLWRMNRVFLQQVMFFVALMVTAAMATLAWTDGDSLPGLAAWAVAVVWFLLAWRDLVPSTRLALPASSAGAIVAVTTTFGSDAGMVLGLVTATAVVALAVWFHDLIMVAVGSLGLLQMLPMVVSEWFPDTMAAPFVLLGVGVVVLALAVWTALRGRPPRAPSAPGRS